MFYKYNQENKAIYVSPISANYGYILPISNQIVSSNTFTVIYGRKPSCEMFIAPISLRKQFSKTFVSYKKYDKKLKEHLRNKRSRSYIDITEIPIQMIELKKSQSCPDLYKLADLGGLSKIMKIFDIQPSYENCVNEYEPLVDYFFGASSEDFDFDD
jgi:hypothetical protein